MKGILGRKLGMTQVFTEDGILIPVTVVEATPNIVLQKKTIENDGYEAIQLGFEDIKESRATKACLGHVKGANTAPKRFVKEIRGNEMTNEVGTEVKVDLFAAGDIVDVVGTSRGKGYMGAIYRNNQKIGPKSHGSGFHRGIGSLATTGLGTNTIDKGTDMAGHEGVYTTTNQNLVVVKVDVENNCILIRGNVPGPRRGLVVVHSANCAKKAKPAATLIDYSNTKED
ncbi:MAG: 50S ribosomal protein L3 [Erysipelotrichaceae bacterium]